MPRIIIFCHREEWKRDRKFLTAFLFLYFNLLQVDEKIRTKMFSLRQTWNDVFPSTKLFALDIKVNRIDPGWPVTQSQPRVSSIHVNPNFFQGKVNNPPHPKLCELMCNLYQNSIYCFQSENDLQAKLQIKQRELLELRKRKLELELAATHKQLELTPVSMDSKPSINNQMPDALTKPPHSMMLAMNTASKNQLNPIGHGVASPAVSILQAFIFDVQCNG